MEIKFEYKGQNINVQTGNLTLCDIDKNFTYQKYLDDYAEIYIYANSRDFNFHKFLEKYDDEDKEMITCPEYCNAVNSLYREFNIYASKYEEEYVITGEDPTIKIKKLADLYKQLLNCMDEEYKNNNRKALISILKKINEKQIINDNRNHLLSVLKNIVSKKENDDILILERTERLENYKNGTYSLGDLLFCDLKYLPASKKAVNTERIINHYALEQNLYEEILYMKIKDIVELLENGMGSRHK